MQRSSYYGLFVFLFYLVLCVLCVSVGNPNPLITAIVITVLTFVWFKISTNWEKFFTSPKDVVINIMIYSGIVSVVAFMSLVFSGDPATLVNLLLYSSPVALWVFIWTDYYFSYMRGKF